MVSAAAQQLIARLGAADQAARELDHMDWTLALQRSQLRLELAQLSQQRAERMYLLGEAVALLELTLIELEDKASYEHVAVGLAEAYLAFFALTHEARYATIANQILRPLSGSGPAPVLLTLARIESVVGHLALAQHWLRRYVTTVGASLLELDQAQELASLHQQPWWPALRQQLMH